VSRWAVVLAGGVGSRFWPLSTPERPKQLLPLATDKPLLQDAVERLRPLVDASHTLVLTNAALTKDVGKLLADIPKENILAEPRPAGTAAALTWAALAIEARDGLDATMLCVHADWSIGNDSAFRDALVEAETVAQENNSLVTVGIVPTRADPGFGYIEPGDRDGTGPSRVKRFVEKPNRKLAEEFCEKGFLWNSGIFVWRVGDFLAEVSAHTTELGAALKLGNGVGAEDFFASVKHPVSVDVGVLERSKKVMVVPGSFGWDDIGTWSALRRVRSPDDLGNVTSGDVHMLDCSDNVVYAEAGSVVMYGVDNLVVVTQDDLTLVTTAEHAADLKRLVDSLPQSMRSVQ
jgi:mannose-1-phosphate guanylyltransferase